MTSPLVLLTAALLVVTKVLDGYTTVRCINQPDQETHPQARRWMKRHGIRPTVVFVVALALVIVVLAAGIALASDSGFLSWTFVILGFPIAIIQLAVAHTNHSGRFNSITRVVARLHARAHARLATRDC